MIETRAIDHVCLWVSSLKQAKHYYETIFALNCSAHGKQGDTLAAESEHVHFFIRETGNGETPPCEQHLAFEVASLDRVVSSLETLGVSDYEVGEVRCFKRRNYKWCEWRDPDGIRLECVEILTD